MSRARQSDRIGRRAGRWAGALAASLAVHGLLVLWLFASDSPFVRPAARPPLDRIAEPVALRPLSAAEWAKNRRVDRAAGPQAAAQPKPPRPEAEKPVKKAERPPGKVVAVAPGNGEEADDARFAAETSNRVEKETISRHRTLSWGNPAPVPTAPRPPGVSSARGDRPARQSGNEGLGQDLRERHKKAGKKGVLELPRIKPRQELALKLDSGGGELRSRTGSQALWGNSDRLRIVPDEPGAEREEGEAGSQGHVGERNALVLSPSWATLGKIFGAPAADLDPTLDDVEEGDATFLNTKEWKYSSFMNRAKRAIASNWDPISAARRHDPTGAVYLYKDRFTLVSVTLDSDGVLRDVTLLRPSGADFIDREAIEALKRTERFPNPPIALRDPDGNVRFNFGFIITVEGTGIRLFR